MKVKSTGADYDVLSLPVDSHGSTAKEVLMQKKGKPKIFFAGWDMLCTNKLTAYD